MPRYEYSASNLNGNQISGVYTAASVDEVHSMLRQKSYYPLDIKELVPDQKGVQIELFPKISLGVLTVFCQQFASILKAGVPISRGLYIMAEQTENKKLATVLKDVYEKVQTGRSLSESFRDHGSKFPMLFFSLMEAGEMSGTLDHSFERMAETFQKDYKLNQKVRNAMIYPAFVGLAAIVIVWYLLTNVVPTFENIFDKAGAALPVPTQILLRLSKTLQQNGLLILAIIALIIIVLRFILHSRAGRFAFDRMKLRIPYFGNLNIKVLSARFTRTLSTLFTAGVSLTDAMQITAKAMTNTFIQRGLEEVTDQVKQGKPLSTTLELFAVFPTMVTHMANIGEESGTLDEMLNKTSEYYENEADASISKMMSLLEPAIIMVLGGIILFIVLSILLPMFNMLNVI